VISFCSGFGETGAFWWLLWYFQRLCVLVASFQNDAFVFFFMMENKNQNACREKKRSIYRGANLKRKTADTPSWRRFVMVKIPWRQRLAIVGERPHFTTIYFRATEVRGKENLVWYQSNGATAKQSTGLRTPRRHESWSKPHDANSKVRLKRLGEDRLSLLHPSTVMRLGFSGTR